MDNLKITIETISVIVSVVTFVLGLIFILKPTILIRLSQGLNRNAVNPERLHRTLEEERISDAWFVNRNRLLGIVVILVTVVIVWQIKHYSAKSLPITVGIVGIILAAIFFLKSTMLTGLSQRLNKNIFYSDRTLRALDRERISDSWFVKHSKSLGIAFVVLALTTLLINIIT